MYNTCNVLVDCIHDRYIIYIVLGIGLVDMAQPYSRWDEREMVAAKDFVVS